MVGFISIICINVNVLILSIFFKCIGVSFGIVIRYFFVRFSNLLRGYLYCVWSIRWFYIVVVNGFYISV